MQSRETDALIRRCFEGLMQLRIKAAENDSRLNGSL